MTWFILLAAVVVFLIVLLKFPIIPFKWKLIVILLFALITAVMGYFSLRNINDFYSKRTVVKTVNSLLAAVLAICSLVLPSVERSLRSIFKDVPETISTKINVYAMTTDYKSAHSDMFRSRGLITDASLSNYANKQFIIQTSVDQENQAFALEKLSILLDTANIWKNEQKTVWDAVKALYTANGDALILNEAYASLISDTEEYRNFDSETIILYSFIRETDSSSSASDADLSKPFSIFIAGSDSRDPQLTKVTRTDVNIIATVNPAKKTVILTSIPRDSYIPNPALDNGYDKLTHMGVYGIENSLASLSEYMDINLDNYVLVNFYTYKTIINVLGGVDIDNPYEFSMGSYTFPADRIHLDGDAALAYVRERKSLASGDFGRNEHQIIVLRAILRKMLNPANIMNLNTILNSLSGTFMTNLKSDSIFKLASEQIDRPGNWNIITYHITGSTGSEVTASMPGQALSVVYADKAQIEFAANQMHKLLNNEDVYQEKMP